ncbi:MAG: ATP-binding cassette domain-containing protein [Nitrospinota bacterium]|nr:ATP-binding cassette domain-containing protein [Nitrospinota bacterium]
MSGAMIVLKEIKKIYKVGPMFVETLKDVDFLAEEGQVALICGEDRTGRSAFMRILGLIEQPTAGEIFIDDENLTDIPHAQMCAIRNATFGYLSDLLPLIEFQTALDNVRLPLHIRGGISRKAMYRSAMASLEYMEAADLATVPVKKLDQEQRKRVALARAIAGEPSVLWVDDIWLTKGGAEADWIAGKIMQMREDVGLTIIISAAKPPAGITFDITLPIKNGRVDFN